MGKPKHLATKPGAVAIPPPSPAWPKYPKDFVAIIRDTIAETKEWRHDLAEEEALDGSAGLAWDTDPDDAKRMLDAQIAAADARLKQLGLDPASTSSTSQHHPGTTDLKSAEPEVKTATSAVSSEESQQQSAQNKVEEHTKTGNSAPTDMPGKKEEKEKEQLPPKRAKLLPTLTAESAYWVGMGYLFGLNASHIRRKKGLCYVRYAAKKGYADARALLGSCNFWGWGKIDDDAEGVKRWLAVKHNPFAQVELAGALEHGDSLPRNPQRARKYYARAYQGLKPLAEQGHPHAQFWLGYLHYIDRIVSADELKQLESDCKQSKANKTKSKSTTESQSASTVSSSVSIDSKFSVTNKPSEAKDSGLFLLPALPPNTSVEDKARNQQAFFWFSAAAYQGHAEAQTFLGRCYRHHIGFEPDPKVHPTHYLRLAKAWYLRAERQGWFNGKHLVFEANFGPDPDKAITPKQEASKTTSKSESTEKQQQGQETSKAEVSAQ